MANWLQKFKFTEADTIGLSVSEIRRFETTKRFAFIAFLVNTIFALNDFLTLDNRTIFLLDTIVIIPGNLFIYLYFRYTKNQKITAIALMIFLNIMLMVTASYYTRASNLELFFFPMMILTFSIIDHKQKWLLYGMVGFVASIVLLIEFTDFKMFSFGKIPDDQIPELAHLTCFSSIVLFFIFLQTIMVVIAENEEKLQHETKQLIMANKSLKELNELKENYNDTLQQQLNNAQQKLEAKEREIKMAAMQGEEMERKRIALDLHDELGVKLSALKLNLSNFENKFTENTNKEFLQIMQLVDDACNQIRDISHHMHPVMFEEQGLINILKDVIVNVNNSKKINVQLVVVDYQNELTTQKELMLYRIILELLNNTIKHANASLVNIQLIKNTQSITILYDDNGKGFDEKNVKKGLGLNSILHRTDALNAKWKIESKKNKGTFQVIELPIN
ncbi:MAG: Signal transduction histidine-protein kinase/phosphatase DegS [Bacteroidota bacterium]